MSVKNCQNAHFFLASKSALLVIALLAICTKIRALVTQEDRSTVPTTGKLRFMELFLMVRKNVVPRVSQVEIHFIFSVIMCLGVYTRPSFYENGIEQITGTLDISGMVTFDGKPSVLL